MTHVIFYNEPEGYASDPHDIAFRKKIMTTQLTQRKATIHDLRSIIHLLLDDRLGKTREQLDTTIDKRYIEAFQRIDADPNQYLMIVNMGNDIVGTCHLTIMPSLTFTGSTRMQIEAVRVSPYVRIVVASGKKTTGAIGADK
jgi:hypothetical protein